MDINSMYISELTEYANQQGWPKFRAKQLYEWLNKKHVTSTDMMVNIPKNIREALDKDMCHVNYAAHQTSREDGTRKFLFEMDDGQMIETVFMKYHHGNSICISSQAGCAMGCKFCASTIGGCIRDLTAGEMLGQVYSAMNAVMKEVQTEQHIDEKAAEKEAIVSNIVVMGTGEPLQNYDNLIRFIKIITDENGFNLSIRNITVSSCGIVPNIKRLADEGMGITFALSLHAPTDEKRKELMPIANKYSIQETLEATDYYFKKTGRRITIEYSLMNGINDSETDAELLGRLLKGRGYHVNLIPVNPIDERDFKKSSKTNILQFQKILEKYGINVTIRRGMGRDIDAACGQLRRKYGVIK